MTNLSRRLLLVAAVGASLALAACNRGGGAGAPSAEDMSMGDPNAPVKMVEYASLSCGHCARFNEETFPAFKAKYVDTGRVQYTMKELLTPPQQVAAAGFLLARCGGASPAKYFKIVDEVFRSQPRWQGGNIRPIFVEIAKANGITEAQFEACLQDQAALSALNERVRQAIADGIEGTPTFYVNGKRLEGSAVPPLAELDAAIAAAGRR